MFQQQLHHEQPLKRTDHEVDFETGQLMERLLAEDFEVAKALQLGYALSDSRPGSPSHTPLVVDFEIEGLDRIAALQLQHDSVEDSLRSQVSSKVAASLVKMETENQAYAKALQESFETSLAQKKRDQVAAVAMARAEHHAKSVQQLDLEFARALQKADDDGRDMDKLGKRGGEFVLGRTRIEEVLKPRGLPVDVKPEIKPVLTDSKPNLNADAKPKLPLPRATPAPQVPALFRFPVAAPPTSLPATTPSPAFAPPVATPASTNVARAPQTFAFPHSTASPPATLDPRRKGKGKEVAVEYSNPTSKAPAPQAVIDTNLTTCGICSMQSVSRTILSLEVPAERRSPFPSAFTLEIARRIIRTVSTACLNTSRASWTIPIARSFPFAVLV